MVRGGKGAVADNVSKVLARSTALKISGHQAGSSLEEICEFASRVPDPSPLDRGEDEVEDSTHGLTAVD
jgi:hypothetical protein